MRILLLVLVTMALAATGCMTAYKGETIIVPITDTVKRNAIQVGFTNAMWQTHFKSPYFGGIQLNFHNSRFLGPDSNLTARGQYRELRLYGGYDFAPKPGKRSHFFLLGGIGFGNTSFTENYKITNFVDSINLKFNSGFQNVFVQGGYKAAVGRSVFLVPHAGAKFVVFNNEKITRVYKGTKDIYNSQVFGLSSTIPQKNAPVFQFGCTMLVTKKAMDYFVDLTYFRGNEMMNRLSSRMGFAVHF